MWHPNDAQAVGDLLATGTVKNAVVMGAGLVGIEMAEAFHRRGVHTVIVEMQPQLFPAMLDAEMAMSVEKYVREKGIEVRTGEKVLEFRGEETVREVLTDKGLIPADLVVLALEFVPMWNWQKPPVWKSVRAVRLQ